MSGFWKVPSPLPIRTRWKSWPPGRRLQVAKLLELTERYCVVYQTLAKSLPVTVTHRVTA